MKFDLIIFDLDDTLLPEKPPVEGAFAATAALVPCGEKLSTTIQRVAKTIWYDGPWLVYGKSLGISWWEGMSASFEGEGPRLAEMRAWCLPFRIRAWRDALRECHLDNDLAEKLSDHFIRDKAKRATAYDGAHDVVDTVAAEYRIAMLTNGVPDLQHDKIARTGFTGRFDPLVISGVVGIGKPDARVYHHLLEKAGISANRALMIGNSLQSDIPGARNAGMPSVWIDHDRSGDTQGEQPAAIIHDIRELPDAIRRLEAVT